MTKRRRRCLLALAVTVPTGLLWRLAPLHLPRFAFKYGGAALWAVAVYWGLAALLAKSRPGVLAPTAAISRLRWKC